MPKHMELYWNAVSLAYDIVNILGAGHILSRFVKPFLENKKRAACVGTAYSAMMLIQYFLPLQLDNNFTAYSLGILSAFTVLCRIDRRNYKQKIFLAATFFSLRWLSAYMTGILTEAVYHIKPIYHYTFHTTEHPAINLILFSIIELMDILIGFAFLEISIRAILKAYVYKRDDMSMKEMFMLILPSVTGMTGYGIMQYFQIRFEMSPLAAVSGIYNGLAFLHFGISVITIVVVTFLFQNIKARQEEKLQNKLLAAQIDSIRQHIEQVESLYQNIRSIKHDVANHILTLERLYDAGRTKEAAAYGAELKSVLSQMTGEITSGNSVTDVILQELKNEAEKRNIHFQSDFYYPTGCGINAFDVSVILSNALQNAVEYAGKSESPHIHVLSYHRNNAYMIEISSSFTGTLQWDEESGLPATSKKKADGHGYGLSNIRRAARKYAGDIAIDLKDGEFCLSIMLMMER